MNFIKLKSRHTESGYIYVNPQNVAMVWTEPGEKDTWIKMDWGEDFPISQIEKEVLILLSAGANKWVEVIK